MPEWTILINVTESRTTKVGAVATSTVNLLDLIHPDMIAPELTLLRNPDSGTATISAPALRIEYISISDEGVEKCGIIGHI